MQSQIQPRYYFLNNIFQKEQGSVFQKNWAFIGFASELQNPNDFITANVGDVPVVVQNFNGTIKAFLNICSHRFSLIQTEKKGNRAFYCPYHGWAYNSEGVPCGIPKKPFFSGMTEDRLKELKLKKFSIDFCGDMVFVSVDEPTVTLREYLGDFFDKLCDISTSKKHCVDINELTVESNWKVVVENTLESYHVNLVHQDTFKKLGASGLDFEFSSKHSKWNAELALREDDTKLSKIHKEFRDRSYVIDGYEHYLVYPNLLISTTYGISYNFSIIEPLSENTTKFTSMVYLSGNSQNSIVNYYKDTLVDFNREVFEEDRVICEFVQKGVKFTDQPGVLSDEEERVHHFQQTYIKDFYNGGS